MVHAKCCSTFSQRLHGRPPHAAAHRQRLDHPDHAADLVLDPQRQGAAALAGLDLEALHEAGEGHADALDQAQGGAPVEVEPPVLTRPRGRRPPAGDVHADALRRRIAVDRAALTAGVPLAACGRIGQVREHIPGRGVQVGSLFDHRRHGANLSEQGATWAGPSALAPVGTLHHMPEMRVSAAYQPTGDQPRAIAELTECDHPRRPLPDAARGDRHRQDPHRRAAWSSRCRSRRW